MIIIDGAVFEWDEVKNQANMKKHHISFETAAKVFQDENRIEYYDEAHSDYEDRYITIGQANNYIIVMVVYTDRDNVTRLISARLATNQEKEEYYNVTRY